MSEDAERAMARRFGALTLVREGAGIRTYTGDIAGRAVIIKTIAADDLPTAARMRLEHDVGTLITVKHHALAGPTSLAREGDLLYLARPLVRGLPLPARLSRAPLEVREALVLGRDLFSALTATHAVGVLHRDIKPSNVIVDTGHPLLRAWLVDHGLARGERAGEAERARDLTGARYTSPEQAGLLDLDVDERSDLYAAGLVLFESLAGRPAFDAPTVGELLRMHLGATKPSLRTLGCPVPRALDEVIARLLRTDPRDRYQSAAAVTVDLEAIIGALAHGVTEPLIVVGAQDQRRTLTEPAFVGRESEVVALAQAVERAREGAGTLCIVEAASGEGKSRLLVEVAQLAARSGAFVLSGQAVDLRSQRPFELLRGVAAGLLEAARASPDRTERITQRLIGETGGVLEVLPELHDVLLPAATGPPGPEAYAEMRTLRALSCFLSALGDPARPAVVLLDDCQFADDASIRLLRQWKQRLDENPLALCHVVIVVAFRGERVSDEHPLRSLHSSTHIRLQPLNAHHVGRLAESMAGPLPAEAIDEVARLSSGSPFMASAVLRGMLECGALVAGPGGWRTDANGMAQVQSSARAAAFLMHRFESLPVETLALLSVGAVLGRTFDLSVAAGLAGVAAGEAIATIDEARARHIVWERRDGWYAFAHDKLREALLDRLPADDRTALHRDAATALEEHDTADVFDVSAHFDAAGEYQRAMPYALQAADQARARHALALAERHYRIALRGAAGAHLGGAAGAHLGGAADAHLGSESDESVRMAAEGLGDVLMLRGRYEEAEAHLRTALRVARHSTSQAGIQGKLGELAFKRGDVKTAARAIESALRLLGARVPRRAFTFACFALWEAVVQILHTALPRLLVGRRSLHGSERDLAAVRLFSRLGFAYWFTGTKVQTLWTHMRALNRVERYPPTSERARVYSEHAPAMLLVPAFGRGVRYAQRSLAIHRSLADPWGEGQALHWLGVVLYASSRYAESVARLRESIPLLERAGDRWEVNNAHLQIAMGLYRLGDLRGAIEAARRVYLAGLEIGDEHAAGVSLEAWAKASRGQLPAAILHAALARSGEDTLTRASTLQAEGVRLLWHAEPRAALDALTGAQKLFKQAGMKNAGMTPIHPWLATAWRRIAEDAPSWAPDERRAAMRAAGRILRASGRRAKFYRNDLPYVLRERGLLMAMRGRSRASRRALDRSVAVATRHEAAYERAQSELARAEIGRSLGWRGVSPGDDEARDELKSLLPESAFGVPFAAPVTLSLADRFAAIVDAGRHIASALTKDDVVTAVRAGAETLLRGDFCVVRPAEEEAAIGDDTAVADDEVSAVLAARAFAEGAAVTFREGDHGPEAEAMSLAGVRSALAAPISLHGRRAFCIVVGHRDVAGLFGQDEERLAGFITTIAGAALENAAGFAEIQGLSASLGERTAQLQELTGVLEDKVRARTEALETAVQKIGESQKLQDSFVSSISHELRTPLTALIGATSTLLRPELGIQDDARSLAEIASRGASRMSRLVEDLLVAFALTDSVPCARSPFDMTTVIHAVIAAVAPNGQTVRAGIPETLIAVGDAERVRAILTHVLSNAAKFSPTRSTIHVRAFTHGASVEVVVRDEGPGVPHGAREKIFDRFFQVDASTTRAHDGVGLGLFIARRYADAMDGMLTLDDANRGGATFRLSLPAMAAAAAVHPAAV